MYVCECVVYVCMYVCECVVYVCMYVCAMEHADVSSRPRPQTHSSTINVHVVDTNNTEEETRGVHATILGRKIALVLS